MLIREKSINISLPKRRENSIQHIAESLEPEFNREEMPLRFVVTKTDEENFHCEIATLAHLGYRQHFPPSIFQFRERQYENNSQFNAVMMIPTGIDCEIGGHAGDATPSARLLASICDNLIIHPNVVNASDINEKTENCMVVEGSVLARLLMGTVGLQKVRANRVLVLIETMPANDVTEAAINSVAAARATLGLNVTGIVCLQKPCEATIEFAESGRASGVIRGMDKLVEILEERHDSYDAVAIISHVAGETGHEYPMQDYYLKNTVNPWGGIEALFTHALSSILEKPTMHAPIMESSEPLNFGLVEPRKAAEVVSRTYMHCILKGLHNSPKIISNRSLFGKVGIISAEDIHALVIPDGALGLPTLAALEQGIPVIAVRENKNLMQNHLEQLPFTAGKYFLVENYLEAAGLLAALKAGVCPSAVRRPIPETHISEINPKIAEEFVW